MRTPDQKPVRIVIGQRVEQCKLSLARSMRANMTPAERLLWHRLRANRLAGYYFRRQQVIAGYIVDFYCHRAGLAVEVDGSTHDPEYDAARDEALSEKSITVIRFGNDEVMGDLAHALSRIL